jgi:secreted trypsin-like serine protease
VFAFWVYLEPNESLLLSLLLQNTGGTCFGDSGGPLFLEDTNLIVGVTSYGINRNCASTGGSYRIDTVDDLEWINSFLSIVALE